MEPHIVTETTMQNSTILKTLESDHVTIRLRQDGIVIVSFHPNTEITVDFQNILVQLYHEITGGTPSLFLFDGGEFVSITKEARENAILMEKQTPTKASAIVVRNLGQKIIADFYYKVNKPIQPYKVFWQHEKAIDWLKTL